MTKADKKYIGQNGAVRQIHLVSGVTKFVDVGSIVGYCTSYVHRGYLIEPLMKKHDCLGKQCRRFCKFEEYPYWQNKQREAEKKKREKQSRRDKRRQEGLDKQREQLRNNRILHTAARCVEHSGIRAELLKIVKRSDRVFVIPYGSPNNYNDYRDFLGIIAQLRKIHGVRVIFRHMRDLNGKYLSESEIRQVRAKIRLGK